MVYRYWLCAADDPREAAENMEVVTSRLGLLLECMEETRVAVDRLHVECFADGERWEPIEEALQRLEELENLVCAVRRELTEIDDAYQAAAAAEDEQADGNG